MSNNSYQLRPAMVSAGQKVGFDKTKSTLLRYYISSISIQHKKGGL